MPTYRTEAIVIRSMDFSESDKIVSFFTRSFGKLRGIAKGAKKSKKRFRNKLELFSHVSLLFFERNPLGLARINDCSIIRPHAGICEDIKKVAYGSYFVELIDGLVADRERNEAVFDLLADSLSLIDCHGPGMQIARIFEIRFLSLLGYQPQLEGCVICGQRLSKKERFFFSPVKGGIVCGGCLRCSSGLKELSPTSPGTLRILLSARNMDFKKIHRLIFSQQALRESEEALTNFIRWHMGKELNSMKFLKKIHSFDNFIVASQKDRG